MLCICWRAYSFWVRHSANTKKSIAFRFQICEIIVGLVHLFVQADDANAAVAAWFGHGCQLIGDIAGQFQTCDVVEGFEKLVIISFVFYWIICLFGAQNSWVLTWTQKANSAWDTSQLISFFSPRPCFLSLKVDNNVSVTVSKKPQGYWEIITDKLVAASVSSQKLPEDKHWNQHEEHDVCRLSSNHLAAVSHNAETCEQSLKLSKTNVSTTFLDLFPRLHFCGGNI